MNDEKSINAMAKQDKRTFVIRTQQHDLDFLILENEEVAVKIEVKELLKFFTGYMFDEIYKDISKKK